LKERYDDINKQGSCFYPEFPDKQIAGKISVMKCKTYLSFSLCLLSYSCIQESSVKGNTYLKFSEKLKPGMIYETIVKQFGEPLKDIGSGLHIYVYPLADSTEIWIGFSEKIIYSIQVDKQQRVIKKLF
jgi:hypothetical protein